jgi:uncharacterized protein YjbI with pentapeptide repeats
MLESMNMAGWKLNEFSKRGLQVEEALTSSERRPQFTIRTAFLAMLVLALAFGWYKSAVVVERKNEKLKQRLDSAHSEIQSARTRAEFERRLKGKVSGNRGLSSVCLDRMDLRGISINGALFQFASFKNCDLRDTTLTGGPSSFQGTQFDGANLADANLTGEGASFQFASFVNADLSGATVSGNLQCASFEGAKLIGARVIVTSPVDFQSVNIDGAQFQGADLSTIDSSSLESCYFDRPPRYDTKTEFPAGFDPKSQGWNLVE